jgi:hypothetical protein
VLIGAFSGNTRTEGKLDVRLKPIVTGKSRESRDDTTQASWNRENRGFEICFPRDASLSAGFPEFRALRSMFAQFPLQSVQIMRAAQSQPIHATTFPFFNIRPRSADGND